MIFFRVGMGVETSRAPRAAPPMMTNSAHCSRSQEVSPGQEKTSNNRNYHYS